MAEFQSLADAARAQGKGPLRVITDLCGMQPDPATKELTVVPLHPGVSRQRIESQCGWPLVFADAAAATPASAREEPTILRQLNERTRLGHAAAAGAA